MTPAGRGGDAGFRILFVCFGNLCRSPMAEGIARHLLAADFPAAGDVEVESAGLAAMEGSRATAEAVRTMSDRGIDISRHRARTVTAGMLAESDLVLAMEDRHTQRLLSMAPDAAVYSLLRSGEAARSGTREAGPSGGAADVTPRLEVLRRTAGVLEREGLWERPAGDYDVPDPIGWRVEGYEEVAALMEPSIRDVMAVLFGPEVR